MRLQEQLAARERLLGNLQGSAVATSATSASLARPSAGATFGSSRASHPSGAMLAHGSAESLGRGSLGLGDVGGSPWTLSVASASSPAAGRAAAMAALVRPKPVLACAPSVIPFLRETACGCVAVQCPGQNDGQGASLERGLILVCSETA